MSGGLSGQRSQNGSSGGSAAPTAARGREEESGLTAGTDALRIACLECLEVGSEEFRCSNAPSLRLRRWCVFCQFCNVCGTVSNYDILFPGRLFFADKVVTGTGFVRGMWK